MAVMLVAPFSASVAREGLITQESRGAGQIVNLDQDNQYEKSG
jgi:hypothetical protein